ncbi:bifunctional 2-polyprenyl-6-hydroxyphenol methylase/3-demethylubiquinol 3-O-methyltransferase UbiG [Polynucleobacter kasalickyi]|uniref:Ubiquinone biosynthesis O-methyltransferase n=1 Tax=Polynucleobacter kasalickyi TaxID=1938817 RepID=A0A1W1YC24_9BURK|nr:bifunctional 2-polyprenyl-6-hydroxyphenol methylase/3-demethylubiquinol 3-O-methyltransferase UbiG [Polynucleobacter kasalickyi]SMC33288.1 3-demethylubiquinone-9 3-methyltransferase [Polynucleobacter kasalickyi]
MNTENKDQAEIDKFSELASRWWDETSEFKPLHAINPLRLGWILSKTSLPNMKTIDIGCGGGILSESLAKCGADTTGIDLSSKALKVAKLHALETQTSIQYELISAEEMAEKNPATFDLVTCMEMLEHVPDPRSVVKAAAKMAKPGGILFFSTLNRNLKSYLMAIIGAEYVLNILPKGTHDYAKFIKPSELSTYIRDAGLEPFDMTGLHFNPITDHYYLGSNVDVNYMIAARKPL